jgi:hypothetical protein
MAKFASEKEGYLVAFWNGESRGTKNMIDTAIQHGIPVTIYSYDDEDGNAIREYIGDIWGKFTDALEEVFSEKVEKGESAELPFSGKNVDIKVEKI